MYKDKYLKYKLKYLELKGGSIIEDKHIDNNIIYQLKNEKEKERNKQIDNNITYQLEKEREIKRKKEKLKKKEK